MFDLETQIHSWSDHLRAHGNISDADIHELENHLRDEIEDLVAAGLTPDESFLISVKRLGNVDAISHEFAKVNTENLWRHLLVEPIDSLGKQQNRRDIALVVIFALLAGTLFKIPELFGLGFQDPAAEGFYFKNLSLFILPFIAAFFLIKRKAELKNMGNDTRDFHPSGADYQCVPVIISASFYRISYQLSSSFVFVVGRRSSLYRQGVAREPG